MAEIRCQICGFENPPELEHCKSCGARLRPIQELEQVQQNAEAAGEGLSAETVKFSLDEEKPGAAVSNDESRDKESEPEPDGMEEETTGFQTAGAGKAGEGDKLDENLPDAEPRADETVASSVEAEIVTSKNEMAAEKPAEISELAELTGADVEERRQEMPESAQVDLPGQQIDEDSKVTARLVIENTGKAALEPVPQEQLPGVGKKEEDPGEAGGEKAIRPAKKRKNRLGKIGSIFSGQAPKIVEETVGDSGEIPVDGIAELPQEQAAPAEKEPMPAEADMESVPPAKRTWSDWEKILPNEAVATEKAPAVKVEKTKRPRKGTRRKKTDATGETESSLTHREEAEAEKPGESFGPLADLQGILPGGKMEDLTSPPPLYSRTLHLTEAQKAQSELLGSILAEEEQPRSFIPQRARKTSRLGQALFAMLFIILLSLPIYLDLPLLALPEMIPINTHNFHIILEETLAEPGSTVLIAADYEPGYYGEMAAASLPVIDLLMEKGAYLATISTKPTGPALAQSLLVQAQQRHPEYSLEENTVNLGYMAGNANALQLFARNPQQAAKYALNAIDMWDRHMALSNIDKAGDFALIIIVTNDIDKAKSWIEQVQPIAAGSTHMLLISSAQAAPVLTSYVDSGQVEGMVAGFMGGLAFEQLTQATVRGQAYWDSYQIGIALAVTFILIGAIYQSIFSAKSRRKKVRRG